MNWEKEFDKDFGAYAIMGKLGKLYNGAFANGTRMSDVKDFIQNLLDKQKEEIKDIIASLFMDTHLVDREDKVINKFYRDISEELDKLK